MVTGVYGVNTPRRYHKPIDSSVGDVRRTGQKARHEFGAGLTNVRSVACVGQQELGPSKERDVFASLKSTAFGCLRMDGAVVEMKLDTPD